MDSNQLDMSEFDMPLVTVSMEHTVREMMSCGISSDEYAARQAHFILCFSLDQYRYRDVVLQAWIHSLGAILFQKTGAPNLNDLRAKFLTAEEIQEIQESEREFEEMLLIESLEDTTNYSQIDVL
jgi:hypothetical protein